MSDTGRASAPQPMSHRRLDDAIAVGIVVGVAALVAGLWNVNRSFGYDEAITYANFINGGSPRRALTTQFVLNNHQMFSAIQSVLWRLGFVSEAAQRLAPVGCAAATVGLVGWTTTRRSNVLGGVLAATVLLLNPMYLDLARSLRGYSLAALAVVVAALAIERSWTDPRRRWLVVQGVAMVVAVTTHTFTAVIFVSLALAVAVLGRIERRHLACWAIAAVAAVAVQFPLIDDNVATSQARGNRYLPWFGRTTVEEIFGRAPWVVLIGISLAIGGWAMLLLRSRRVAAAVAAAAAWNVGVLLVLWQVVQPFDLYPRFFIGLIPFVAVLCGVAIQRVPWPAAAAITLVSVALMWPQASNVLMREGGLRDTAALVDAARADGHTVCGISMEAIVVYTPAPPFPDFERLDECDVFVSGLGLPSRLRPAVTARFERELEVGGLGVWSDVETIDELLAAVAG